MNNLPLVDWLRQVGREHAERIAFRFEDRAWTYAELDRTTDALAVGLHGRGIRRGDRVAFLLPNSSELVFLNLACLKLGVIAVPMNVRLKGAELAYILNHAALGRSWSMRTCSPISNPRGPTSFTWRHCLSSQLSG